MTKSIITTKSKREISTAKKEQINRAVDRILKNRSKIVISIRDIITDLMYLKENSVEFRQARGMTVEQFIKAELGFSKASFYQHIKAYQLCLDYDRPEVYEKVNNYKTLLEIAKIDDKEKQKKAFKKIERDPESAIYDTGEIKKVHPVNYKKKRLKGYLDDIEQIDNLKRTNAQYAIANHYQSKNSNRSKEKTVGTIETGIIERLIKTYESILNVFERDKDDNRSIITTYKRIIKDLKDIVDFSKKTH